MRLNWFKNQSKPTHNFSTYKSKNSLPSAFSNPVIEDHLREHVEALCSLSEPRHYKSIAGIEEACSYITQNFRKLGYRAVHQPFTADNRTFKNVIASYGPMKAPRIIIGAHYDVAGLFQGADDNASGVAGLLELARIFRVRKPKLDRRIDLVAYCLEEPPFFGTQEMGSYIHASSLHNLNVKVHLMMSLEMIGYFRDEPESQTFPTQALRYIYPTVGNFIGVVGDLRSAYEVQRVKELMRKHSHVDVQAITAPRSLPGVELSDHRSYWDVGYPALMLTDTAFYRNPNYHSTGDVPQTLDYKRMKEVVEGVYGVAIEY